MDSSESAREKDPKRPRNLPRLQHPDTGKFVYANFPAKVLAKRPTWFRNHERRGDDSDFGVWYFTARTPEKDPEGRFDLSVYRDDVRLGTCYLASTDRGAVNEFLGPDYFERGWVDGPHLEGRVVSEVELPREVRVADATSPDAFTFLVNSELSDTSDYELTQAYANRFADEGFEGLLAGLRFSPGGTVALALFGSEGAPIPKPVGDPSPRLMRPLVEEWGIPIEDPPTYPAVDVVA